MTADIKVFEPGLLYRYRSLDGQALLEQERSAIANDYLWCSRFGVLNDPMEGSYELALKDKEGPRYQLIRHQLYSEKTGIGICSFSETNDNAIMWAHYADGFSGICIEYRFKELRQCLDDRNIFVRIAYNEGVQRLSEKAALDREAAKKVLSSKSYRWLHEREWRLFSPSTGRVKVAANSISCVYLGYRMRAESKKSITASLAKKKIPYKEMSLDGYSIRFEKCVK
jgi:hypothetical protein